MEMTLLTENNSGFDFYPTPKTLIDKMINGIDWRMVTTILEPSAGKGDIAKAVKQACIDCYSYRRYGDNINVNIDCIEKDTNLQHILTGEGFRVVYNDFLKFNTYKKYDLIIMNPPFSEGAAHLLKALKMQKDGGNIICLLNAETIKNPYTQQRKELVEILKTYNADIEYIENSFSEAERKTDVEIALIKVVIPKVVQESDIYERLKKSSKLDEYMDIQHTDIAVNDFVQAIVAQFNNEVGSGVELLRQYYNLIPYTLKGFDADDSWENSPMLKITFSSESSYNSVSVNEYVKAVRLKYWKALFANKKFMGRLTSSLQDEYRGMVDRLKDYDFNEYNIDMLVKDMNSKLNKSIEDTIMDMFDTLSCEHSYYKDSSNNIHYYNGWCSNKAHKINKKVILPCYGVYDEWRGSYTFRSYKAVEILRDIEKVLDFLDGDMTSNVDLSGVIEAAKENPKNIKCKYFTVTFYKKGTVHIVFDNLELLEKFNIYAAKNRKWLPPYYGTKSYNDMSAEDKKVIDEFQGKENYNKVMQNTKYYLQSTDIPMIAVGA